MTKIRKVDRRMLLLALSALALAPPPALAVDRQRGLKPPPVAGVPDFVDLDPIVLPVIERDTVSRQIGIMVTLELADGQPAEMVEPKRPQLTDAFIRELYAIYGWRSRSGRVVDEDLIKARLLRTANGVLGGGVVHAILIRKLLEQGR